MKPLKPKLAIAHRGCWGGVIYAGPSLYDQRPTFMCTKCKQTWTCGKDGGQWACLVPSEKIA